MGKQSVRKSFRITQVHETELIPPDPSGVASASEAHGLNYPPFIISFFNFEDDEYLTVPEIEIDTAGAGRGTVLFWYDVSVDSENIYIQHYSTGPVSLPLYMFLSYVFNVEAGDG